jgi:class 3 adenylate cyclase
VAGLIHDFQVWNCIYFPNQAALKEFYLQKSPVAHTLCVKHLEHRSQLHEKRRIDDATTDSKITESFIAGLPERPTVKIAALRWIPNDLNPFIVRPVQSQVEEKQPIEYLTEMRQVTIQFINIVPTTFQDNKLVAMVNKAYQIVCKIVSTVRGVVNKVSLFDKDCMILVLFGLRGIEHEVESQNALKSAFAIRKTIKRLTSVKMISIGVTNGLVYCGVVGHPFRREYTVIGGAVNKAARIMCAYEGKVTCDHETYKSCKLSSLYFQVQSAMKLKGIADAGHIFEYNEDFDKMAIEDKQVMPLIGRYMEVGVADVILEQPEVAGWTSICFKGESKVGKTKLLQEIHKRWASYKYVCSLALNEALQRPYYTVSTVYQQLYDIMSRFHPKVIADLPRHLWDLNEILQAKSSTSIIDSGGNKEKLQQNFLKVCKVNAKIVVFIDNVQFIDNRSLELLETVLQKKLIALVCAGCFEDNTTWNTMWKLSLSNQIKVFNIEPLPPTHIALLMCNFLNVKGVSKKLYSFDQQDLRGSPRMGPGVLVEDDQQRRVGSEVCLDQRRRVRLPGRHRRKSDSTGGRFLQEVPGAQRGDLDCRHSGPVRLLLALPAADHQNCGGLGGDLHQDHSDSAVEVPQREHAGDCDENAVRGRSARLRLEIRQFWRPPRKKRTSVCVTWRTKSTTPSRSFRGTLSVKCCISRVATSSCWRTSFCRSTRRKSST